MNHSFSFLTLKNEFYEEYKIPQLPFPLSEESLRASLKGEGLPLSVLVDHLLVYLEEEPEELEKYGFTLMKLSYYAGTWEMEKQNYDAAYKYLKVAQKHGDIKNVSIIFNLGRTCMIMKKYEEAREVFFLGYAFTKHQEFIPEIWMFLIVSDYLVGNVEESYKVMREFFVAGNKRYPTSHAVIYKDLNWLIGLYFKDEPILEELEKYRFFEPPLSMD